MANIEFKAFKENNAHTLDTMLAGFFALGMVLVGGSVLGTIFADTFDLSLRASALGGIVLMGVTAGVSAGVHSAKRC